MVLVLVAGLVSVPGAAAWSGPRAQELPGSLATSSQDPDTGGRNTRVSATRRWQRTLTFVDY